MGEHTIRLIEILHDDLAETKRKLEIAVKGLLAVHKHMEVMGAGMAKYSTVYNITDKCLKDLGVE
jgi:hypothetical protein